MYKFLYPENYHDSLRKKYVYDVLDRYIQDMTDPIDFFLAFKNAIILGNVNDVKALNPATGSDEIGQRNIPFIFYAINNANYDIFLYLYEDRMFSLNYEPNKIYDMLFNFDLSHTVTDYNTEVDIEIDEEEFCRNAMKILKYLMDKKIYPRTSFLSLFLQSYVYENIGQKYILRKRCLDELLIYLIENMEYNDAKQLINFSEILTFIPNVDLANLFVNHGLDIIYPPITLNSRYKSDEVMKYFEPLIYLLRTIQKIYPQYNDLGRQTLTELLNKRLPINLRKRIIRTMEENMNLTDQQIDEIDRLIAGKNIKFARENILSFL